MTTSGLQPWVSICSNTSLAFCHWAPAGPEREKAEQLEAQEEVGAVGCKQAQPTVHSLMQQRAEPVALKEQCALTLCQSGDQRIVPAQRSRVAGGVADGEPREQPVHAHWTEQPSPPGLNQQVLLHAAHC